MKETKKLVLDLNELLEEICLHFRTDTEKIKSDSRKSEHIDVRFCFCYVANVYYNFSKMAIGRVIQRDHTSIIHAINTVRDLLDTNDFRTVQHITQIKERLGLLDLEKEEEELIKLQAQYDKLLSEHMTLKFKYKRLLSEVSQNRLSKAV